MVLMQSYNALADSAHAPVVVRSFFAAQHPSMVASSGAQRLTAASAGWSRNAQNNQQQVVPPVLFFGRTLSFWMCMLDACGTLSRSAEEGVPQRCQPPRSIRTTLVHAPSPRLPQQSDLLLSTAVRRILQEAKELANDKSTDYTAAPLEVCRISPHPLNTHSIFTCLIPGRYIRELHPHLILFAWVFIRKSKEWHCTIRGPAGTEFEGGLYHFRILLPSEYPFRPPSILMLTPNGRFELNTKACPHSPLAVPNLLTYPRYVSASPTVRSTLDANVSPLTSRIGFSTDHEESWQPAWGVRTGILPSLIIPYPTLNRLPCNSNSWFARFFPPPWKGCAWSWWNGCPHI